MPATTIIDGRREYHIYVRSAEVSTDGFGHRSGVREWLREFRQESVRCRAVCPEFTSEDYGIAKRLLTKHNRERLDKMAEIFWLQYSDPLDEGYGHPLKLFAAAIPDIERRMG